MGGAGAEKQVAAQAPSRVDVPGAGVGRQANWEY